MDKWIAPFLEVLLNLSHAPISLDAPFTLGTTITPPPPPPNAPSGESSLREGDLGGFWIPQHRKKN